MPREIGSIAVGCLLCCIQTRRLAYLFRECFSNSTLKRRDKQCNALSLYFRRESLPLGPYSRSPSVLNLCNTFSAPVLWLVASLGDTRRATNTTKNLTPWQKQSGHFDEDHGQFCRDHWLQFPEENWPIYFPPYQQTIHLLCSKIADKRNRSS